MDHRHLILISQTTLRNADITRRLDLPNNLMNHLNWGPNGPLQRTFHVVDLSEASWDMEGRMSLDQDGILKAEVYGSEWRSFANTKRLRVGDVLLFYRHPDPTSRVVVLSIEREMTLMGATFSSHTNHDSNI